MENFIVECNNAERKPLTFYILTFILFVKFEAKKVEKES